MLKYIKQYGTGFILLISLTMGVAVNAQVHQPGASAIDLYAGRSAVGVLASAGYLKNTSEDFYLRLRGYGEFGRLYNVQYSHYGVDITGMYRPFYISDFLQLNIGGGLVGGYEKIGGQAVAKDNKKIGFLAGVKGTIELEAFLNDQGGFFVQANQSYMLKQSLGKKYFDVGIGLRIFLNNSY